MHPQPNHTNIIKENGSCPENKYVAFKELFNKKEPNLQRDIT